MGIFLNQLPLDALENCNKNIVNSNVSRTFSVACGSSTKLKSSWICTIAIRYQNWSKIP
uniref:Uncharacterized protein n=1 Tax=Anguilla anguilla TaxID=7936 RepID=A0A0E9T8Y9_ANGAN